MYGERTRGLGAWSAADALPEQRLDVPGVTNETRHVNNPKENENENERGVLGGHAKRAGAKRPGHGLSRPAKPPKLTGHGLSRRAKRPRNGCSGGPNDPGHGLSSPSGGTGSGRPQTFHGPVDLSPSIRTMKRVAQNTFPAMACRPKHVPGHGLSRPSDKFSSVSWPCGHLPRSWPKTTSLRCCVLAKPV